MPRRQPCGKHVRSLDAYGITSLDWAHYPIIKFSEVPDIDTVLMHSPDQPTLGVGECTFGPTGAGDRQCCGTCAGDSYPGYAVDGERIAAAPVR